MAEEKLISSLGIYDYDRNKLCDLYDSQNHLAGQAYNIQWVKNYNGIPTLTFVIPYKVENKVNYRWKYMRSEYLIRITRGNKTEWFIASKPVKSKSREITGTVTCNGFGAILKTKNIYLEFDDENGIGTIQYLMGQILKGTGWTLGHYDTLHEADGTTEKVRSLKSGNKQGALGLITTVCNLFKCYPIYDSENMQVNIYSVNNRSKVMELEVGRNAESVSVNENSDDIVTRLYVEGEYSEYGYVGIDDVNPTGLNFLLNFDYYKEIGVFTQTHQTAVNTYLTNIKDVKDRISTNETIIINKETEINNRIGQCIMSLYYASDGFTNPKYTYGNPTDAQKQLKKGDEVYVLKNDWTYRVVKITTTAAALIQTGDYGIAKFATKSAGSIGAKEVQVEAKQKQISNLQKKISATTKADKIAEYNHEISELQAQITDIYENENGLYQQMYEVMSQSGYLKDLNYYEAIRATLLAEQDDIEATFISAMGNMLRDGYWQNNNYISGQEESLYADAVEMSEQLGKPKVTYTVNYIRVPENNDIPIDDIEINQIARLLDEDIEVYENLFVTKVTIGIDNEKQGSIEVSNEDIALSANDLGSLLSRMSQLADLIEQKNALYERAKAITASGGIYAERLNGQINVLKNQLLSTVSNWYTDDQGNIMFESADGGSAMMLCGAGFMIASEKDNDGNFIWRTYGTGHGFTADEIVAGFISAERIEAGSIATSKLQADVGSTLVITGNPAITQINNQIAPEFDANTSYKTGDLVMHNGVVYMFTQNHTGAWNSNHVVSTNLSAQIELLPDKIIQYVGEKGYSRTFVQLTDPALDPDNMVVPGDYWVKSDTLASVWENPNSSNVKWNDFNNHTWGSMMTSMADMYCRKGTGANAEWVPVNDINYITEAYTRIEQTRDQITQEAYRANAAEGQLDTKINQTAHDIMLTAERSYIAQTDSYDSVNKIIDEAISLANDAATSAKEASIAKTAIYQSADAIVTAAVATAGDNADEAYIAKTTTYQTADQIVTAAQKTTAANMAPAFSTSKAYAIGDVVSYQGDIYVFTTAHAKGAWNADHVSKTNLDAASSGKYIAQTASYQTADAIVNEAVTTAEGQAATNIAPAFSTTKAYAVGDVVSYHGVVYVFTTAHAKGAWNASHVTATNMNSVATSNYIAKTSAYQTADAIVTTAETNSAKNVAPAFSTSKAYAIGDLVSYQGKVYVFTAAHSAGAWDASHVSATNMSDVSNGAYLAKTSTYQTADAIVSTAEIQAARNIAPAFSTSKNYAVGDLVSRSGLIYVFTTAHPKGTWNEEHVSATNMTTQADGSYIAKTSTYQTAASIVSAAQTYTNDKLTNYSTRAQTSTMISEYVTDNTYGKVSGIEITANGIEVSGSKYVKIKSGGTFTVDSGNFSISSTGKVAIAPGGGTISTWTIGQQSFYNYVEDGSTHIRSHYVGLGTGTYAIWAGAAATEASTTPSAGNSPFWVKTTGEMKATLGTVGGWTIGTNYIGNAGTRGDSTVGMAIVSSDSSMAFWAGGAFTGGTPTFSVTKGGALTSTSGKIGGWSITANRIASGSGTGYVAMDSNTSNTYAIWAGNSTAGSAPFRVQRDGTVYLTKLKMVKETSTGTTTEDINFSSSDNRLRGATVLGWDINSSTGDVTISTTYGQINFNRAASATVSGAWSGKTFTATVSNGEYVQTTIAIGNGIPGGTATAIAMTFDSNHIGYGNVSATQSDAQGVRYPILFSVDATSVYNDGKKHPTLTGTWSNNGSLAIKANGNNSTLASVLLGETHTITSTSSVQKISVNITDSGTWGGGGSGAVKAFEVDLSDVWKQGWNDAVDSGRQVTYYNLGDTSHASQELFYKSGSSYISIGTGWTKPTTVNLVLVPQKKT